MIDVLFGYHKKEIKMKNKQCGSAAVKKQRSLHQNFKLIKLISPVVFHLEKWCKIATFK